MCRYIAAIVLACCLGAFGAEKNIEKPAVMVLKSTKDGQNIYSTAFALKWKGKKYVYAARHAVQKGGTHKIRVGDDEWDAVIRAESEKNDFVLLETCAKLDFRSLKKTEKLKIAGSPEGKPVETAETVENLLVLDAEIPSGYSGAPVFDDDGDVVGVVRGKDADTSRAVVVPANKIRASLEELLP